MLDPSFLFSRDRLPRLPCVLPPSPPRSGFLSISFAGGAVLAGSAGRRSGWLPPRGLLKPALSLCKK